MPSLSVTVITKNEAHNIEACLRSVAFADEIIVLDSGSTDETVRLAAVMGAKVSERSDWKGFGIQKNRALELATSDWVLSIDADERVSSNLQAEIRAVIQAPAFSAYSIPRLSSYCGQYMRNSGWYPDRTTRLFHRQAACFSNDSVHEKILISGQVGRLDHQLTHESYLNFEAVLGKINLYSTAGAQNLFYKKKSASLRSAIGHGMWAFVRTYFLHLGFLDGRLGLILAISNAEGTYYRYLKLWLLHRDAVNKSPS